MVIRWGIIGLGLHADNVMAPAIRQAKDCRLVAVYSRDKGRAQAFATKHEARGAYDSLDGLLANPEVDTVYIASPNFLHAPQTIQAARAGKHVLCEKPMALTVADCQAMIDACRQHHVKLGLGFHLRHHPAHLEARKLVASGEAGRLALATAQFSRGVWGETSVPPRGGLRAWWSDPALVGGGAIMGSGVHALDLLRFLTGEEVTELTAFVRTGIAEAPVDEQDVILLQFQSGAFGTVTCSRLLPNSQNNVVLHGSRLHITGIQTLTVQFQGELVVVGERSSRHHNYFSGNMYVSEIEDFNQAIREGTEPAATGLDGLRVCQLTEAVFKSSQSGQTFALPAL